MAFKYNGTNVNTAQISGPTGYIAEGSPIFQNGILSAIDSQNYIMTSNSFDTTSSFSIILKYKLLADGNLTYFIGNTNGFKFYSTSTNANNLGGMIRASSEDEWTYLNVPTISHQADTWYILQFDYNGTNTYTVIVKNESGTVLGTNTTTSNIKVAAGDICFGYNGGSAAEKIDLNNTYIYINNKLWFWQPMEANYVIQNGGQTGYTIVGSPTIEDGVVSGFSSSDYTRINKIFTPKLGSPIEVACKFTTGLQVSSTNGTGIFGSYLGTFGFVTLINGRIQVRIYINGSNTNQLTSTNPLETNTTYWAVYTWNGYTTHTLKFSKDNQNWTILTVEQEGVPDAPTYIGMGTTGYFNSIFLGSIDLNETYIKVNGEYFFNGASKLVWASPHLYLEGPVTYTKVGNVDITDNVASGFENGNYLSIDSSLNLTNNFEFVLKVKFNSYYGVFLGYLTGSSSGLSIEPEKILHFWFDNQYVNKLEGTHEYDLNTWYYIKFIKENNLISLYYSEDGIDYILDTSKTISSITTTYGTDVKLGSTYNGTINFSGEIDLNESYILNPLGTVWFYGRNYATQNIAPVPANYSYGTTTTTDIGFVDTRTQKFTELPSGVLLGNDNISYIFPYNLPIQF